MIKNWYLLLTSNLTMPRIRIGYNYVNFHSPMLTNFQVMELILKHRAKVNALDKNGQTALHRSARDGNVQVKAQHRSKEVICQLQMERRSGLLQMIAQSTLTVRGTITVQLVSSLTGLDLTKQENMLLLVSAYWNQWIQTCKTGEQMYSDTSP